jgi:hypothetical protein
VLHLLGVGQDLFDRKLFRRLPDQLMLLGKILRSEDLISLALFEQKAAARNLSAENCGNRSNDYLARFRGESLPGERRATSILIRSSIQR